MGAKEVLIPSPCLVLDFWNIYVFKGNIPSKICQSFLTEYYGFSIVLGAELKEAQCSE